MAKGGNTVKIVWDIVEPLAKELGFSIWDVRFLKEGSQWYLRVFIDKEGGVGIDDCVDLSHAIDGPIDEANPIEQAYNLQVQSPGIERELCRDFHFECYLGEKIQVRLIKAFEGKREYKGILIDYDSDSVTIAIDDETEMNILKKEASWIKADDFDGIGDID